MPVNGNGAGGCYRVVHWDGCSPDKWSFWAVVTAVWDGILPGVCGWIVVYTRQIWFGLTGTSALDMILP